MNYFKNTIQVLAILLVTSNMIAQEARDTLKEEVSFPSNGVDNILVVNNVNGSITLEAYSGSTVKIETERIIKGKKSALSNDAIAKAQAEIGLNVEQRGKKIYVFLDSPYSKMDFEKDAFSHTEMNSRREYNYTLNMNIKVPANTNVKVSTVNNGDILIRDIKAKEIEVNNINGAISLQNVSGKIDANALNKDIDIVYAENPKQDSKFNSLNGDINIKVSEALNANVSFTSLNGDLFTNMVTENMTAKLKPSLHKDGKGKSYKADKATQTKFGNGGVQLDFNVLNGDVTIKK